MKYIHFIRHGETDYNLQNKLMGCTDIPLNYRGEQQALKASRLLVNHGIEIIYCSPLSRAKKTAEIISSTLAGSKISVLEGLRERNYAEFEGLQKTSEIITKIGNSSSVERMADFSFRISNVLQSIIWSPSILVVSHSGVYKCMMRTLNYCSENNCERLPNAIGTKIYQNSFYSAFQV